MSLGKQKTEVQKGDSLSKIAKNAGISVAKIKELNPQIQNPNLIKPGQQVTTGSGMMGGIKSLGSKFKESLNKPANPDVMKAHMEFLKQTSKDDSPSGVAAPTPEEDMSSIYDENRRRYEEFMRSQQPQQPRVTPDMRREALNIFESQRGAGQMPYYMAASQNATSPAFQYAAQNYSTLGGAQRLGPRPMEMMSVAERRQINDMAQGMADQEAARKAAETDYQAGMDMVMRGGKGGSRTGRQMPPGMVGLPRDPNTPVGFPMPRFGGKGGGGVAPQLPPNYGGGMPRPPLPFAYGGGQRSPFASILASRFGGFGGQ